MAKILFGVKLLDLPPFAYVIEPVSCLGVWPKSCAALDHNLTYYILMAPFERAESVLSGIKDRVDSVAVQGTSVRVNDNQRTY